MDTSDQSSGYPFVEIKRNESGFGYDVTVDGQDMIRCASAHIDINGPEPANVTFKIFAGADYFGEARLTVDVNEWPDSVKEAVYAELTKWKMAPIQKMFEKDMREGGPISQMLNHLNPRQE